VLEIDFSKSSELVKYLLPAIGVTLTLLIPKVWDWWRESSKNRYENRKIINKSLFHLLKSISILTECEYYLSVKGFKVDYGIYVFVGELPDKGHADLIMSEILKHYKQTLDLLKNDIDKTCVELSAVEPFIANQLSMLNINSDNMGEMKKYFDLPFLPEHALSDIADYRKKIESSCNQLAALINHKTAKRTQSLINSLNEHREKAIQEFKNKEKKTEKSQAEESLKAKIE
jgi:hypothetical protein